jgi:hypothetical protein
MILLLLSFCESVSISDSIFVSGCNTNDPDDSDDTGRQEEQADGCCGEGGCNPVEEEWGGWCLRL